MDAQVMLTIAEVAVEKANSCATDLDSFNSIEFTEKLVGITPFFLTYIFNTIVLHFRVIQLRMMILCSDTIDTTLKFL